MTQCSNDSNGLHFSKRRLINFLSLTNPEAYEKMKLSLFQWSFAIVKGDMNDTLVSMRDYIPELLTLFDKRVTNSSVFISTPHIPGATTASSVVEKPNIYSLEETDVHITTIHSVKGQTHTGTLYLESFYRKGNGNYESERLATQLKGAPFNPSSGEILKQTTKMMYVGLSRPTHLLCIGVHRTRFTSHLSGVEGM